MISIISVLSTTINHGFWFGSKKYFNNVDDFNSTQKNDVAPGPSERNVLFPRPIYHNLYKKTYENILKNVKIRRGDGSSSIGNGHQYYWCHWRQTDQLIKCCWVLKTIPQFPGACVLNTSLLPTAFSKYHAFCNSLINCHLFISALFRQILPEQNFVWFESRTAVKRPSNVSMKLEDLFSMGVQSRFTDLTILKCVNPGTPCTVCLFASTL